MLPRPKEKLSLSLLQRLVTGLGMLALLSTLPVAWTLIKSTDMEMRENLLVQANIASKAIDAPTLAKLTGTESDLSSPNYRHIKEQLIALRSASSQYHFIYIMGQRKDGTVFFYVDSEPETSPDYSAPGEIYKEASYKLVKVFNGSNGLVEGPVADQWGNWVSALAPIYDTRTGNVIAIIGIDIGASKWEWEIATHVLPSIGFMAAFLVLLMVGLFVIIRKSYDDNQKSHLHRL